MKNMTRRSLFGVLSLAPSAMPPVLSAPEVSKQPVGDFTNAFSHAFPDMCVACGAPVLVVLYRDFFPDNRMIVQCSSPACSNRHPWVQDGNRQYRVSANAHGLLSTIDANNNLILTDDWQYGEKSLYGSKDAFADKESRNTQRREMIKSLEARLKNELGIA